MIVTKIEAFRNCVDVAHDEPSTFDLLIMDYDEDGDLRAELKISVTRRQALAIAGAFERELFPPEW